MDHTDGALIERFVETNDLSFFKSLVRRYQNRVYSLAFRIVGTVDEAEEVVQETFVKVHQNIDTFRRDANFQSWLFRIVHNICMDILRTRHRRAGFQLFSFDPNAADEENLPGRVTQIADAAPNPAEVLDNAEREQMIASTLAQLPDNQRTVLVLFDIEGFSYQEIAEITGATIGTVRSRLHYGRLKMRELLEPYFSFSTVSTASR